MGAGPGDPGLLTMRAAQLLRDADLVAIDALVSPAIRALISPAAEIVNVGKRSSAHTLPQDQINQLLIDQARTGRNVVRLKGGDPFVFGRGGEEAEELLAAGIAVEIVPGISSAIAGPAYAGIPVTHRAHSTSLTLITGHESDESKGVDWSAAAKLQGTIVFLMGLGNLPAIVSRLIEHGMRPETPVAVISRATTPRQCTVVGTLRDIEESSRGVEAPALIVVGSVVTLHDTINWFESRPLFGVRIVVTRARDQASRLVQLLEQSGAQVIEYPTIEIIPPESWESLDAAVAGRFDWIIFTSVNGVSSFFKRLAIAGRDARALSGARIAAVGDATAAALKGHGILADLVPSKAQSVELLPHFPEALTGSRIAVVRAVEGREELITELKHRGADVHLAVAYQSRPVAQESEAILRNEFDLITFTSSSTVENFFASLDEAARQQVMASARFASIGPVTSATLRSLARAPEIEADNATVESLHDAIMRVFTLSPRESPRERVGSRPDVSSSTTD